jgi:hypothetical protein
MRPELELEPELDGREVWLFPLAGSGVGVRGVTGGVWVLTGSPRFRGDYLNVEVG